MLKQRRPLTFLLPLAVAAFLLLPLQVFAQLRGANDRENFVNAPPTLTLTSDTTVVKGCVEGQAQRVQLNADAKSPNGLPIRYRWSTTAGTISGDGPIVTWDLAGLSPGTYKALLQIAIGDADGECQAFTSKSVLVVPCPPPAVVCPNVSISCPTSIVADQPLTFSSSVTGGTGAANIYNWEVSAGTIIEGQGTPTIKVDTKGLAGETIRATLTMGGLPLNCSDSCAVQVPLPPGKCRKFDEFPDIERNDEKARLDNYGIELQNDPTSTAYVTVFPGRSAKSADAQRRIARIVDYLVNSRGIDSRRIVTRVGPARDQLMVELWACPQGITPPPLQ